ncbi:hypothetical protein B7G68_05295 [Caulobacter segnis]|uniref:Uncharacterized protein n=2 Tax=Caulobacter segnis TaxID=88688 RepID=D5VIG2_CAUST|nr:hypothetical protein [Caulobacter segnis]ADG09536.1 hypothetical protein Cseg_1031 [Caulobacter segnis ATCC 21756]AVQ01323.1 hypothetical protein B7G68_05295 [Caulobacter segnis]
MRNGKAFLISAIAGALTLGAAGAAFAASDAREDADKALFEIARGNNWLATNLQKRATAAEPTVENRFNLATGYQLTGRLNSAKTYYQSVARDGQGVTITRGWRADSFDAGLEAADRLLYIDWLQNGATRSGGAVDATQAATNVSATVGGPGEYEVTDDQARALDRQARAVVR